MTKEILNEAKQLIAIGCFCIGTDQVDLEAASVRGVGTPPSASTAYLSHGHVL